MGLCEEGAGSAWLFSVVQVQLGAGRSLRCSDDPMDCSPTRLLSPWGFPGKNTAVGCHFLLHIGTVPSSSNTPSAETRNYT